MWNSCVTIAAIWVSVMIDMHVMPVIVAVPNVVARKWIISPIIWRMPAIPDRTPEPVIDDRTININRLNHVVCSIYILITYDLHTYCVVCSFLHIDTGYILIDILGQNSLKDDKVLVAILNFYHAQVVNYAVAIEIKVVDVAFFTVELLFELLQVIDLTEESSNSLQVEVLTNV